MPGLKRRKLIKANGITLSAINNLENQSSPMLDHCVAI